MHKDITTKYQQISTYVEELISEGGLKPGDKLPSVRALAEKFKTTGVTVSRGLQLLAERNLIVSNVGSGSFVADPALAQAKATAPDANKIGMFIHAHSDAYAMMLVKAISEAAGKHGIQLRIASVENFRESSIDTAKTLKNEGCAALILPWFPYNESADVVSFAGKAPLPFTLPSSFPGLERHEVAISEKMDKGSLLGMHALCEYFRMRGSKRIALLGPDAEKDTSMRRMLASYSSYVYERDLTQLTAFMELDGVKMEKLAMKWAAFKDGLSVICYDDVYAIRFMAAMRKLGLSAPSDYWIAGHNDSPQAAFAEPSLTSIRGDYAYLGEIMVKSAMAAARGGIWQATTPVPNTLVVRESCGGLGSIDDSMRRALAKFDVKIEIASHANARQEVPA